MAFGIADYGLFSYAHDLKNVNSVQSRWCAVYVYGDTHYSTQCVALTEREELAYQTKTLRRTNTSFFTVIKLKASRLRSACIFTIKSHLLSQGFNYFTYFYYRYCTVVYNFIIRIGNKLKMTNTM